MLCIMTSTMLQPQHILWSTIFETMLNCKILRLQTQTHARARPHTHTHTLSQHFYHFHFPFVFFLSTSKSKSHSFLHFVIINNSNSKFSFVSKLSLNKIIFPIYKYNIWNWKFLSFLLYVLKILKIMRVDNWYSFIQWSKNTILINIIYYNLLLIFGLIISIWTILN